MALRVVLGWIAVNVGALLLLAIVDVFKIAGSRLARRVGRTQTAEQSH